ncbi:MAG TPA: helix-turn-helix domain-containing protein, partial [Edaphobacter sp.]|nr:helix-turn-helix domain-containing protein [Edaphobacter sp.]
MSIKVASLVRKYGPQNHGDFVVLLALADHANDAGGECWPSVKAIAAEMRIGERSVARSLSVLENDGWISVMRRSRDHKGNSYKLVMEKLKSPATETGDNDESPATETGEEHADVTCQPVQ